MQPIYLDYNSTTPVKEHVFEAMKPYFVHKFGNAASTTHPFGWVAKEAIDQATSQIAQALGCEHQQLLYTSGSTEAINLAIKGVYALYAPAKGKHMITCQTEHKAVLDVCRFLEKHHGASITYLPVNQQGEIDLQQLEDSITPQTILVSIMHANNETGIIHPIKTISNIVHSKGSMLFSDCTQSVGKIPIHIDDMGIDLCCISAHKFYGPKGIGVLYYRRKNPRVSLQAQIHGGGHQNALRSGTLNVPAIVGMGEAINDATSKLSHHANSMLELRNLFEKQLNEITPITILSSEASRLPNTSNILFHEIDANRLIQLTNGAIAASTGSACTSATLRTSHVLQAMNYPNQYSLRISLGHCTTIQEMNKALEVFQDRIDELK